MPLAPTLPPPQNLRAIVTAEGVVLAWTTDSANAVPGLLFNYQVLRRLEGTPTFAVVNTVRNEPHFNMTFIDHDFEWEKRYDYKLVPITQIASTAGSPLEVEGADSPVVSAIAKDIFPPEKPVGVQAVFSSVGQKPFIDLTWTPNNETDLAGYDVYRREDGSEPVKISTQLVKAPAFRDENTKSGSKYFYSVIAVDLRGNQSPRSAEASESVPTDIH